jgi:DNA-binding NarL/FixJ family response regulator
VGLSQQEAAVFERAVAGMNNKGIAVELGLTEGTIQSYWQRIFMKTGCKSQKDVLLKLITHLNR